MESVEIKVLSKIGISNPYKQQKSKNKNILFSIYSLLLGAITSLGFAPFNLWWLTIIGIGGCII